MFPTEDFIQRSLESEKKKYWFALCDSEELVDDVSQSLPYFTCRKDGSLPEINRKCGNYLNINTLFVVILNPIFGKCLYRISFQRNFQASLVRYPNDSKTTFLENDDIIDGNLVTCRNVSQLLEIRITSASIRDIRITTQKSKYD